MNAVELIKVINNIPVKGEVCAKDLLPEKKPLDMKAYIVNTDISTDPGEHWVAIYFRRDQVIYFNSYGRPPEEQYVLPFLERNSSRWIHNKECLQSPWSKVCGMWCIYIIHQLNKGLDLNTSIHQELYGTGEDLYQNDRDIGMWFSYNYARVILSQNGMEWLLLTFYSNTEYRLVNVIIIHITFQRSILSIICCKYVKGNYCKQ